MSNTPKFESLAEAKDYLKQNWRAGVTCPCCDQYVKLYGRKITSSMAWALVLINKYFAENPIKQWLHVQNYLSELNIPAPVKGGDFAKLVHWEILEAKVDVREDGSNRVGYYKITPLGQKFVRNTIKVPKIAYLYNQKFYGFSEEMVSIKDCLKDQFNYDELMGQLPVQPVQTNGQAELGL